MNDFQIDAFANASKIADPSELNNDLAPDSPILQPSNLHEIPRSTSGPTSKPVPSLTNSPGCSPGSSPVPATPTTNPSINSQSASMRAPAPLRRVRTVRTVATDAWATPASVSWTRTRKTVRKVSRQSQSTNWALPF